MRPRKRFGQHFLTDESVLQKIVTMIAPSTDDHMVEIGPGQGAMTAYLLPHVKRLDLIEIDRDLVRYLQQHFAGQSHLHIHESDVLKFDFASLDLEGAKFRVVGNLPYNISTPLLFKLFAAKAHIHDMVFMLQKEVVERLAAEVGAKNYGRLSVMAQYHCRNEFLFSVPPTAFHPPPKVESAVLHMQPQHQPSYQLANTQHFEHIVQEAFSHRRKTIHNALKKLIEPGVFAQLDIDPKRRPQELSVQDYVNIANGTSQQLQY